MGEILVYTLTPPPYIANGHEEVVFTTKQREVKRLIKLHSYAMILIDLDGHAREGMNTASFIRHTPNQYMTPILIFSSERKYEWEAFHTVHCYDYFMKPLTPPDVMKVLCLCLNRMESREKEQRMFFTVGNDTFPVPPDDILYLDRRDRTVVVHTTTTDFDVPSLSLSGFIRENGADFLQIHRSTIINRNHIRCVDFTNGKLELCGTADQLPIGRAFMPVVRKLFDET